MAFRKRNAVISTSAAAPAASKLANTQIPGIRPSPYDSRPTTSTGTPSLDTLLAGHSGLPLGTSLLIEEHGTTDFAGILTKYYAAEGLVQGHQVHVLGLHESWKTDLPGIASASSSSKKDSSASSSDKMKIAWRYETLGSQAAFRDRESVQKQMGPGAESAAVFCHSFDLSKKLGSGDIKGQITFQPSMTAPNFNPQAKAPPSMLKLFIRDLAAKLAKSPPEVVHRVLVPGFLLPTAYAGSSSRPDEALQFLHGLRALLRQYTTRLTAVITVPVSLYPKNTGLIRWMEILSDGVLELIPLQSSAIHAPPPTKGDSKSDEQTQGLLKVHSLPIFHEKGGGSSEAYASTEDQSFSLSRSKGLVIRPFSLPPMGEEEEEKKNKQDSTKSMEF